jgi:hypothetical protein
MKKTFSNRILDWILIGTTLLFSILTVWNLLSGFDFFSSYLLRITFALTSITALLSLLTSKLNGERFSRIFILVTLIFPAVFITNLVITDLVFYGANRTDLLQNPYPFLKLVGGIILFYVTLKFSTHTKVEQIKDYGILIIGTGIFMILFILIRTFEPNFVTNDLIIGYPMWKTIVKNVIGIAVLLIGTRIIKEKMEFKKGLIWTLVLTFIFGLI